MKAKHKVTGVTVSVDEAVLRRLGPEWELAQAEQSKPTPKRSRRKAAAKPDDEN